VSRPSFLRRTAVAVGTTTLITPLLLVGGAGVAAAGTPELSPEESGQVAAGYLARTIEANDGFVAGFDGTSPDFGSTSNAVLALVEAGVGSDQVEQAVDLLQERASDYGAPGGTGNPGALGYLLLVAGATGEDETDFGGVNLPAELAAVEQDETGGSDEGLYGEGDATFDGVFRQSLALLGLAAVGEEPSDDAVDFLLRQQCDDGSWTAYREDTDEACESGSSEVDSTAIATQALVALGVDPDVDPTGFLQDSQADDGGWQAWNTTNSNTTSLAISALVVLGEDVGSEEYEGSIGSPYDVLQSLQVGCEATGDRAADRGAFDYDGANASPQANDFATVSAALSVQGAALPVEQPLVAGDDSQPVLTCGGPDNGSGTDDGNETDNGTGTDDGTGTDSDGGGPPEGTGGGRSQGGSGGAATTSPRAADGAFTTGASSADGGSLPRTGLDTAPLLALGLGALGAGVAAVAATTRRRRSLAA
jgi:hypothetical protein